MTHLLYGKEEELSCQLAIRKAGGRNRKHYDTGGGLEEALRSRPEPAGPGARQPRSQKTVVLVPVTVHGTGRGTGTVGDR